MESYRVTENLLFRSLKSLKIFLDENFHFILTILLFLVQKRFFLRKFLKFTSDKD